MDIRGHRLAKHWPLRYTYPHTFTCQMDKSLTKGERESKVMFCRRSGDLLRRCLQFSFVRVTFKGFLGANTIWLSSAWSEMVEEKRQERWRTDTAVEERPAGGMFRDERQRRVHDWTFHLRGRRENSRQITSATLHPRVQSLSTFVVHFSGSLCRSAGKRAVIDCVQWWWRSVGRNEA